MKQDIFDFDKLTFNSVPIGERINEIGKEVGISSGDGYYLVINDEQIVKIIFKFGRKYSDEKDYEGRFSKSGSEFEWDLDTSVDQILNRFGKPDDQWKDDSEVNLTYRMGKARIEFSWRDLGEKYRFKYVDVEVK